MFQLPMQEGDRAQALISFWAWQGHIVVPVGGGKVGLALQLAATPTLLQLSES